MPLGNFTFSYPLWKKVSFVILIFLTLAIFYFGKVLTLDKYKFEFELAKRLSADYEKRNVDVPFVYEPNPGVQVLVAVNERLANEPFWQLAMFLRWFWVAFMVLAFPYIRQKPELQKT